MLEATRTLLEAARQNQYAVGAFNVYNLEGALAVTRAAADLNSPVILQVLPSALAIGGSPLIRLCLAAGDAVDVPVSVHLDHCRSKKVIQDALNAGISSVMADGSMLAYDDNLLFTKEMAVFAESFDAGVEAELGRLAGTEDHITVQEREARMTDPAQAADFIERTGVHALAVCIGNMHGKYKSPPRLDFDRLRDISRYIRVPLVLHGTSGLPDEMIHTAVNLGVSKFNVNTEVRSACIKGIGDLFGQDTQPELIQIMDESIATMTVPIKEKIRLFGSQGKAGAHKKQYI